ncbi:MAG: ABC transporter ATP-binding protein [Candidatus Velthaea sp.]
MAAIAVEHLSKRYASGLLALSDINLEIADGEFVSVVGPSGCGKSTLLRIMAGLDVASEGRIVMGAGAAAPTADQLASAVVFQEQSLFPWMTVEQNVALAFDSLNVPRSEVARRVAKELALVGLTKFAKAYPHQLSGGMKQRAGVARAFAVDPPILYMDEPFGSLDEQTRVAMAGELMALWERMRKTVVFITHGIEEAITLADRVVVISSSPGTVKEILTIDFPRPRDAISMRGDAKFGEYVVRIWDLLRAPAP